jgi:hypothetical protein
MLLNGVCNKLKIAIQEVFGNLLISMHIDVFIYVSACWPLVIFSTKALFSILII